MPDTPRTLAALQALLADNATGDISAQDVRDMLVSQHVPEWMQAQSHRLFGETAHVDDQFFSTGAAPGTSIAPSGTSSWVHDQGVLTLKVFDTDSLDLVARAFPITSASAPMTILVGARSLGYDTTHAQAIVMGFCDGAVAGSNIVGLKYYTDPSQAAIFNMAGTFTSYTQSTVINTLVPYEYGPFQLGFAWTGANAWQTIQSTIVGNARTTLSHAASATALTPTHFFIGGYNEEATAGRECIIDFSYIRVSDSDLS